MASSAALKNIDLQSFVQQALDKGSAAGIQAVLFNKDGVVASAAGGKSHVGADEAPMTTDSVLWMASCSKLSICLLALQMLEDASLYADPSQALTLADIDDADKLLRFLPEFKPGSGHLVTQVFADPSSPFTADGATDEQGRRKLNLRPATKRVTLAQLLTHSAGLTYNFNDPNTQQLIEPEDKSTPHRAPSFVTGKLEDIDTPLMAEPGETYQYGVNTDWVGQFVQRASGKNLRVLLRERIFKPLGIPDSEIDIWLSPEMRKRVAGVTVRGPEPGNFVEIPFGIPSSEDGGDPAPGYSYYASAPIYATLPAYCEVLSAVLRKDAKLLSASTWDAATPDALAPRGTKFEAEVILKSCIPQLLHDVAGFDVFPSPPADGKRPSGVNLLQQVVVAADTDTGKRAGTFGWAGLANTYYFIDRASGIGAAISTQLLPFYDPGFVAVRKEFEKLVYSALSSQS